MDSAGTSGWKIWLRKYFACIDKFEGDKTGLWSVGEGVLLFAAYYFERQSKCR